MADKAFVVAMMAAMMAAFLHDAIETQVGVGYRVGLGYRVGFGSQYYRTKPKEEHDGIVGGWTFAPSDAM